MAESTPLLPSELRDYVEQSLRSLVKEHQDLNASFVAELDELPSSVDFARFVQTNRPVVIRNGGQLEQLPALAKWRRSDQDLYRKVGDTKMTIAMTPNGNADAIVHDLFTEPAEKQMTFRDFMSKMRQRHEPPRKRVLYAQSQNGNLSGELSCLSDDVGYGPSFASQVFGAEPDSRNLWIGDARSVTSLHKDPYQNIYCVIRGSKTFTLFPPTEFYCLHERRYPLARFVYDESSDSFTQERQRPPTEILWISVDPLAPRSKTLVDWPRYAHARPLTVTVNEGDYLYLPALWYHHVQQHPSSPSSRKEEDEEEYDDELVIAVNWWFDMDMSAPLWPTVQFVRKMTLALDGVREVDEESDGEDRDG